jgi:hypothetical protein
MNMAWQTIIEVVVLISIWIAGHLCLFGAVCDKYKRVSLIAALLCMVVVYSIKPSTMDLFGYSVYFDTGYWPYAAYSEKLEGFQVEDIFDRDKVGDPYFGRFSGEPGFAASIKWLSSILPHGQFSPRLTAMGREYTSDSLAFAVIVIGLIAFVAASRNFLYNQLSSQERRRFFLFSVPITLGSIFFFVGSQNAIRQFLMLSLCMLAISYLSKRRYMIALLFSVISISMHHWGWVFVSVGFLLLLMQKVVPVKNGEIPPLNLLPTDWLGLVFGILMVITIKVLGDIGVYHFAYAISLPDWQEEFRITSSMKILALFFVMIISELIAGTTPINPVVDIRQLRRTAFFLIVPLAALPEIFSRTYYLFFAIETLYIVWALTRDSSRIRFSGALVFSFYAIAPNGLNVLAGKGWHEVFWMVKQEVLGI